MNGCRSRARMRSMPGWWRQASRGQGGGVNGEKETAESGGEAVRQWRPGGAAPRAGRVRSPSPRIAASENSPATARRSSRSVDCPARKIDSQGMKVT